MSIRDRVLTADQQIINLFQTGCDAVSARWDVNSLRLGMWVTAFMTWVVLFFGFVMALAFTWSDVSLHIMMILCIGAMGLTVNGLRHFMEIHRNFHVHLIAWENAKLRGCLTAAPDSNSGALNRLTNLLLSLVFVACFLLFVIFVDAGEMVNLSGFIAFLGLIYGRFFVQYILMCEPRPSIPSRKETRVPSGLPAGV